MKLGSRIGRGCTAARACLGAILAGLVFAGEAPPAAAQWGDAFDQPRNDPYAAPPRRRARDNYYRDDNAYGARQARRYTAPPQEAPRQFYWPWEERPQQAQPQPQPQPTYRPSRPRAPAAADAQRPQKRRARPAPVAAPPKPAVPKAEPNTQIAVFGDSLADHLSKGLDDVFEDNADVAVLDRAKGDSGLVRKDVVDWPKAAEDFLKANPKVSYALVMLGANDRQPIREGDQSFDPLSDRWREIYRDRVDAMVKVFADRKIPLIWVGTPPMRSEGLTTDLAAINDIVRERVAKGSGTYVDVWPGFVDDRNRYTPSGPDLEGQNAKLRTQDGVHFTRAGARKLAHFADVELKRLMGAATPSLADQPAAAIAATPGSTLDGSPPKLDDTAAIDRQITAMLPSLPEPPGIPALPVKPAAGPVVPLGRAEVSPGGVLTSGRPRDADTSGNVERALQRGASPLPQPGRADDFRWPPG
ncbi:SGNH/GDSL hydrolase family protein [Methylobacterium nigriterrae]|uniref:SGNH/GDSL hydrolase family protein n=1 Tax=Methylobacterium nigriterrae TaxID=3127512 RepID=UPI003D664A46